MAKQICRIGYLSIVLVALISLYFVVGDGSGTTQELLSDTDLKTIQAGWVCGTCKVKNDGCDEWDCGDGGRWSEQWTVSYLSCDQDDNSSNVCQNTVIGFPAQTTCLRQDWTTCCTAPVGEPYASGSTNYVCEQQ